MRVVIHHTRLAQRVRYSGFAFAIGQRIFAFLRVGLEDHTVKIVIGVFDLLRAGRIEPFCHAPLAVVGVFCFVVERVRIRNEIVARIRIGERTSVRQPDLRDMSVFVHRDGEPRAALGYDCTEESVFRALNRNRVAKAILHALEPA